MCAPAFNTYQVTLVNKSQSCIDVWEKGLQIDSAFQCCLSIILADTGDANAQLFVPVEVSTDPSGRRDSNTMPPNLMPRHRTPPVSFDEFRGVSS